MNVIINPIRGDIMTLIDFRSDTTTQPTAKMRQAMAEAKVGDDVYGDDPTVIELENLAARLVNMEAAMFVASGTMGNQLAIMTHTQRGDEILTGYDHHVVVHEVGAMAILSGVMVRAIKPVLKHPSDFIHEIRSDNIHFPKTSLVCLENALSNGEVIAKDDFNQCIQEAKRHNLLVHVDGARLFNATTFLNVEAKELIEGADSLMFCLSKGLGAPIGSMLCGSNDFIKRARKNRKILGGGWRQAGVLAAAGIVALHDMVNRLQYDHQHATLLYSLLKEIPSVKVSDLPPQINMVFFTIDSTIDDASLIAHFRKHHMLINPPESGMYRIVTHVGIESLDIHRFIQVFKEFLNKSRND